VYHPDRLETGGTWDYFLAAMYFNAPPRAPKSLAVVGMAAGTIPKQYTAVFGPIPIDGIEIDPAIVEVGRRWFAMTEPNLNVIVEDGRVALARSPRRYDVIAVDAYRVPYIPWHLTTREFFEEARAKLADDGVLVINVGRTPGDDRLVRAIAGTLRAVFPSVHVAEVPDSFNSIVYATARPTRAENLRANLERLPESAHPLLRKTLARVALHLGPTPPSDTVFTDDLAPVEFISNAIVLDFFLRGGRELVR
ncbi:MAG: fused MFS/spermidine synthase, partial [Anaerolineales bacterium]|nr:fused MFS/spermidine synthase [Anaerolineales bacterium]